MPTRMTTALTMLLIAGIPASTGLSAQQPGMPGQRPDSMPGMMGPEMMMGGMMGQGMMGSGMMRMMGQGMGMMATGGPGPTAILRMSDVLELSEEQVDRLEEIRLDFHSSQHQEMSAAMSAHGEANRALEGDSPDFEAYEDALSEASSHMVRVHVAMARAAAETRQVLTDEQRERLQRAMRMMQGMMGRPGMGRGMMRGPRMPR